MHDFLILSYATCRTYVQLKNDSSFTRNSNVNRAPCTLSRPVFLFARPPRSFTRPGMRGDGPALCKDRVRLATCRSHIPMGCARRSSGHVLDDATGEWWSAGGGGQSSVQALGLGLWPHSSLALVSAPLRWGHQFPPRLAPHTPICIPHMQIGQELSQWEKCMRWSCAPQGEAAPDVPRLDAGETPAGPVPSGRGVLLSVTKCLACRPRLTASLSLFSNPAPFLVMRALLSRGFWSSELLSSVSLKTRVELATSEALWRTGTSLGQGCPAARCRGSVGLPPCTEQGPQRPSQGLPRGVAPLLRGRRAPT